MRCFPRDEERETVKRKANGGNRVIRASIVGKNEGELFQEKASGGYAQD